MKYVAMIKGMTMNMKVYISIDKGDAVRVVHERNIYIMIYMAYPTPPLFIERCFVM